MGAVLQAYAASPYIPRPAALEWRILYCQVKGPALSLQSAFQIEPNQVIASVDYVS